MSTLQNTPSYKIPDTLILIMGLVVFAWLMTFFVSPGVFETEVVSYQVGEKTSSREVLKADSFRSVEESSAPSVFSSEDEASLLSFAFNGMTSGDKYGAAVGVIMFILIIGGAFGILMSTQSIDKALMRLIHRLRGKDIAIVPVLCFVFSLGGAVFGMGEEAIVFAMIIAPIMVSLGYDAITAVMCTYISTQIGFATSWMNPFNVAIAQGLADIPMLSGSGFRLIMWIVFTLVLMAFTTRYALKVKSDPKSSKSYESDDYFRQHHDLSNKEIPSLSLGDMLVLMTLLLTIVWVICGVVLYGFYIPEIATQFFTMGIVIGIIASVFKLNGLTPNKVAEQFRKGAADLLAPALVVGFAQGILIVLGGTDPEQPSVLNTLLHHTANFLGGFSADVSAVGMFFFQSIFNFFVTWGSGQAALTMPLMAPIADLVDVSRQVAVLAFQLGDGLTNIIVPTSASLMGTLGVTKIQWANWASFVFKFLLFNFVLALGFIIVAVHIQF